MEAIPGEIMFIKPYLLRSEEMKDVDPIISYYTLKYALRLALEYSRKNGKRTETKTYLLGITAILQEKGNYITENIQSQQHFEKFIKNLFVSAENQERKSGSTKETSQKFLILSYFIDSFNIFGEISQDWLEKKYYCIRKAENNFEDITNNGRLLPSESNENNRLALSSIKEEEKQNLLPKSSLMPSSNLQPELYLNSNQFSHGQYKQNFPPIEVN